MLGESEQPFIIISIVSSIEPESAYYDILQKIASRSKKLGNARIEFGQEDIQGKSQPFLKIIYPSFEKIQEVYHYKTQFFVKVLEDFQKNHHVYDKLFSQAFEAGVKSNPSQTKNNYLLLKYRTNFRSPLLRYYEFGIKLGTYVGSMFYMEEIEDGFLLFYQREEDFIAHQVDRLNLQELILWFEERGFPRDHPSVQVMLEHMKKIRADLVKKDLYRA
ncbi:MAG: hypothetical protein ACTSYI_09810 [Promethearchaeota archaeon]